MKQRVAEDYSELVDEFSSLLSENCFAEELLSEPPMALVPIFNSFPKLDLIGWKMFYISARVQAVREVI